MYAHILRSIIEAKNFLDEYSPDIYSVYCDLDNGYLNKIKAIQTIANECDVIFDISLFEPEEIKELINSYID